MVALIILIVIILLVTAVMLIPVGVDAGYEDGELHAAAKAAGKLIMLYPKPPDRAKKAIKSKPAPPPTEKKPQQSTDGTKHEKKLKLDFSKEEIFELVKRVLRGFGIFGRKLRVDRFHLNYIAAGYDPYNTTVMFGYVNACLCALAPICAQRFDLKDLDVRTDIDYNRQLFHLDFGIAVSIRIGAIFHMIFSIAFGALGILIRHKIAARKVAKSGCESAVEVQSENNENIKQDERNDGDGE